MRPDVQGNNRPFELAGFERAAFRNTCLMLGLLYTEDRRFLSSTFTVYGPDEALDVISSWLSAVTPPNDATELTIRSYQTFAHWWNPMSWFHSNA